MRLITRAAAAVFAVGSLVMATMPPTTAAAATTNGAACQASFRPLPTLSPLGDAVGYVAEAVNRAGEVAGRVAGGGPLTIWHPDGSGAEYTLPWAEPQVSDMNNRGHVLGWGFPERTGARKFWVFMLGDGVTPLTRSVPGTGDRRQGRPVAINDEGALVGSIGLPGTSQAAYWPRWDAKPQTLALPSPYQHAEAWSISNRGVITGLAWAPAAQGQLSSDVVIVRWRDGVPQIVPSPVLTGNQQITHVAGPFFGGSSDSTLNGPVAYLGTAASFPAVDVPNVDGERIAGLTRTGLAVGYGWSDNTNQFPIAFIASPGSKPSSLNRDFQVVFDPHDFDHMTALLLSGGTWSVGSCLSSFLDVPTP